MGLGVPESRGWYGLKNNVPWSSLTTDLRQPYVYGLELNASPGGHLRTVTLRFGILECSLSGEFNKAWLALLIFHRGYDKRVVSKKENILWSKLPYEADTLVVLVLVSKAGLERL